MSAPAQLGDKALEFLMAMSARTGPFKPQKPVTPIAPPPQTIGAFPVRAMSKQKHPHARLKTPEQEKSRLVDEAVNAGAEPEEFEPASPARMDEAIRGVKAGQFKQQLEKEGFDPDAPLGSA